MPKSVRQNSIFKSIKEFETEFFPRLFIHKEEESGFDFQKIASKLAEKSLTKIKKKRTK